ncbi:MAG TPA: PEP-CTERM sorting domain-containing protein [Tepidisphaeraceae bacterium]|jgi:hypothetical protein|nr:PEP-CTERM sorting domain-containing protein [Tepidisphaeraceae bacterium]
MLRRFQKPERILFLGAAMISSLLGRSAASPILPVESIDFSPNAADQPLELPTEDAGAITHLKLEAVIRNPTGGVAGVESMFDVIAFTSVPAPIWTPYSSSLTILRGPDSSAFPQDARSSVKVTDTGNTITGNGVLVALYIDTLGFNAGRSFPLSLAGGIRGAEAQFVGAAAANIPVSISNDMLTITPEPASMAMLLVGTVGLLFRRRRSRFSTRG